MTSSDNFCINVQDDEELLEQRDEGEGVLMSQDQPHGPDMGSCFLNFIIEKGELTEYKKEEWGKGEGWRLANSSSYAMTNLVDTREGKGLGVFDKENFIVRFQKRWNAEGLLYLIIKRSSLMSFQIIDFLTDVYFAVALHFDDAYKGVDPLLRLLYLIFLILSVVVSSVMPIRAFFKVDEEYLPSDAADKWNWKGRLALIIAVAFDMPIHLLFHKDLTAFKNGWLTVSAYRDIHDYKKWSHIGLLWSHSTALLIKDLPLFILSVLIGNELKEFTFVMIMALTFSLCAVIFKLSNVMKVVHHRVALPSATTLIAILRDQAASISDKEKAASTLKRLAAKSLDQLTRAICENDGMGILINLVESDSVSDDERALLENVRALLEIIVEELKGVESVEPSVALVRKGTDAGKLMAAKKLMGLADEYERAIERAICKAGGIEALVTLVKEGTREVRGEYAAGALNNLSQNGPNRNAIREAGGIVPLVTLVKDGTYVGKKYAAHALYYLSKDNDTNKVAIRIAEGIGALVTLVGNSTADPRGREYAARALMHLAFDAENKAIIFNERGIEALVTLVEDGTDPGKEYAASMLMDLAFDTKSKAVILNERGIKALVTLLENGVVTEVGKEYAAGALHNLSHNDRNKIAIREAGGIKALETLEDGTGTKVGKEYAAGALRNLLPNNDDNQSPFLNFWSRTLCSLLAINY